MAEYFVGKRYCQNLDSCVDLVKEIYSRIFLCIITVDCIINLNT